jgi:hypothetical protein
VRVKVKVKVGVSGVRMNVKEKVTKTFLAHQTLSRRVFIVPVRMPTISPERAMRGSITDSESQCLNRP